MVPQDAISRRRAGARKIKRATAASRGTVWSTCGNDSFDHVRVVAFGGVVDLGRKGTDIDRRIGQQIERGARQFWRQCWQITLQVDYRVMLPIRVEMGQCFVYAVGARGVIGAS